MTCLYLHLITNKWTQTVLCHNLQRDRRYKRVSKHYMTRTSFRTRTDLERKRLCVLRQINHSPRYQWWCHLKVVINQQTSWIEEWEKGSLRFMVEQRRLSVRAHIEWKNWQATRRCLNLSTSKAQCTVLEQKIQVVNKLKTTIIDFTRFTTTRQCRAINYLRVIKVK